MIRCHLRLHHQALCCKRGLDRLKQLTQCCNRVTRLALIQMLDQRLYLHQLSMLYLPCLVIRQLYFEMFDTLLYFQWKFLTVQHSCPEQGVCVCELHPQKGGQRVLMVRIDQQGIEGLLNLQNLMLKLHASQLPFLFDGVEYALAHHHLF